MSLRSMAEESSPMRGFASLGVLHGLRTWSPRSWRQTGVEIMNDLFNYLLEEIIAFRANFRSVYWIQSGGISPDGLSR
jgi:hypothetical protein